MEHLVKNFVLFKRTTTRHLFSVIEKSYSRSTMKLTLPRRNQPPSKPVLKVIKIIQAKLDHQDRKLVQRKTPLQITN